MQIMTTIRAIKSLSTARLPSLLFNKRLTVPPRMPPATISASVSGSKDGTEPESSVERCKHNQDPVKWRVTI